MKSFPNFPPKEVKKNDHGNWLHHSAWINLGQRVERTYRAVSNSISSKAMNRARERTLKTHWAPFNACLAVNVLRRAAAPTNVGPEDVSQNI